MRDHIKKMNHKTYFSFVINLNTKVFFNREEKIRKFPQLFRRERGVSCIMRSIYRIRRYITVESCHHLVRALILSRLDYANSLMLGMSAKDRNQLQKLQNRAARVVFRAERLHPSAPLLRTLHWLPVDQRIKFKVLLYIFKGVHGLAPPYLNEFLVPYSPGRPNLRSGDDKFLLYNPRTTRRFGDISFHADAPRLWNALPSDIRNSPSVMTFRKRLMTYLFPPA